MPVRSWNMLFVGAAAFAIATMAPASAQLATKTVTTPNVELKTDMFDYEYVKPKNPAHERFYATFREMRLLEGFKEFFSPLKFHERIKLKLEGCDGIANAYFFNNEVKVCYEYFDYIVRYTPKMTKLGLTPRDALIGPVVDVFLHEVGHALVQMLDIPFFAREEDVADYIASYILLQFTKDDARRLIVGTAMMGGNEAKEEQEKAPELVLLADTHSLPAVRYFNRWCMAYGSDPVLYADAVTIGQLTESRAKRCRYEFKTNEFAIKTLIAPYVDQELRDKVMAKKWFAFEMPTVPANMTKPASASADATKK